MWFSTKTTLFATLTLVSGIVAAQVAVPNDPEVRYKLRKSHNKRISLAFEIPQYPQYFRWSVDDFLDGRKVYGGAVPVYVWDEEKAGIRQVKTVPAGTELKIEEVAVFLQRHFYSIPLQGIPGYEKGWVDGLVIKRTFVPDELKAKD